MLFRSKSLYGGPPPTALIDAETGTVIESIDREKDPAFVPPVAEPPPDIFERDNDIGPDDDGDA